MAVSASAVEHGLAEIVGRDHLVTDPPRLRGAAVDDVVPRFIARPASAEQVSRVLALASAEALAVAPRGSGSSLGLGNPPRRLDLVLDLRRLTAIADYVPEDMVATVGAATPLDALAARFAPRAQRLALDPPGAERRTIGGVLATHASGPLRFRYGTGRDLLLGVRFVQADGTITWGGSRVVKSVTGYDVPKLLVGSLGTLGVMVDVTLRLHPMPPATGTWLARFEDLDRAAAFVARVLASPIEPERLVLLGRSACASSGFAGEGPACMISVGSVPEAVASQAAALGHLAEQEAGRIDVLPGSAWTTVGGVLDAPVGLKLACEIRRVVFWIRRAESLAASADVDTRALAHAGNGVVHLELRGEPRAMRDVALALRNELRAEGGSLVVERAPAGLKPELDAWGPVAAEALAIMWRLKREFDPSDILNPGRFAGGI